MRFDRFRLIIPVLIVGLAVTGWFVLRKTEPADPDAEARDLTPATALSERRDDAPSEGAPVRSDVRPTEHQALSADDILGILDMAAEPTLQNVQQMVEAIFALPRPWEAMDRIVGALRSDSLDLAQTHAALLAIEAALRVMFDEKWMAVYGPDHGPSFVSTLLLSLGDVDSEAGKRIVTLLSGGELFTGKHVADFEALLAQEPLANGIERLLIALAEHQGQEGTYFLLSLVDHPNAAVRAAAIGYFMKFDPTTFKELALEYIEKAGTVEERGLFLRALVSGLPSQEVMSIVCQVARSDLDKGHGVATYIPLFGELVANQTTDDLYQLIREEAAPSVADMLISMLESSQTIVIDRLLETELPPELRSQAMFTLSRYRADTQLVEWALDSLRNAEGMVLSDGIGTAYNLARKADGADWSPILKSELSVLVNDELRTVSDRTMALRALLLMVPADERQGVLAADAPDYLKDLVRGK